MKFSTVLGTVLPKSPMTTRPASSSPIRRSKNTLGRGRRKVRGDQGRQTRLAGPTHLQNSNSPTPTRPKPSQGDVGWCPTALAASPPSSLTTHPSWIPQPTFSPAPPCQLPQSWAKLSPDRLSPFRCPRPSLPASPHPPRPGPLNPRPIQGPSPQVPPLQVSPAPSGLPPHGVFPNPPRRPRLGPPPRPWR